MGFETISYSWGFINLRISELYDGKNIPSDALPVKFYDDLIQLNTNSIDITKNLHLKNKIIEDKNKELIKLLNTEVEI